MYRLSLITRCLSAHVSNSLVWYQRKLCLFLSKSIWIIFNPFPHIDTFCHLWARQHFENIVTKSSHFWCNMFKVVYWWIVLWGKGLNNNACNTLNKRFKCKIYFFENIAGTKRKRWSFDEERDFDEAFEKQIKENKNITTEDIRAAKKKFRSLQERSEAVIRSRMNNIKLGKIKK